MNKNELTILLSHWEQDAFEYEEDFLKTFCGKNATDLTEISFGGEKFRFTYVLDCGQHIADSRNMSLWFDFLEKVSYNC